MKKKMKCECGGTIEAARSVSEGFLVDCLICNKCYEKFFTIDQAKEVLRLRELNKEVESKRKIINVGDSIAAILPKKIMKFGVKAGMVDTIRVLSSDSIEIKFGKNLF